MMRSRYYIFGNYGVYPPVHNGDQMPSYLNNSTGSKTLTLTDDEYTFVKENHKLDRERVTVMTQVSSDPSIKLPTDFCFKGAAPSSRKLNIKKYEGYRTGGT